MSSVSIQGNASGTGIFTIASPNSNTNRTLTLPNNTGTILTSASTFAGTGPAFSVYPNADQTGLTSTAFTKVAFTNELFDTANCFDSATNYRFTPTTEGYYQLNFSVYVTASNIATMEPFIYKNGSAFTSGQYLVAASGATGAILSASNILYLNGSTDAVEFYVYVSTTTGTYTIKAGSEYTYASGALIRAA
jgi:hypothetical protein